ncbi:aminofutalosine deaminase family hydrolase [Helicobacter cappadocius]|uniref:Metal-dependent hydrolase n=1 Tax=Helicobacter cappadocius TaxID=3063998 RepID=A0AA90PKH8_9HELI|nr:MULTISPECIES: metal-dependent hydrolase [unclassified Helicobacter]MDO7253236.1 metal-dependent hydrolase [Helicobacter sp. faydin-H75]MDP2539160.1 metal-dependent hydrolase [Helicobacter sp. faydin-H76]
MNQEIRLIGGSKVFVCDEGFTIIDDGGVAFNTQNEQNFIIEIGKYKDLKQKYPNALFYEDAIILPSFVNAHIHFEFGNNISSFEYGGFDRWLGSVMKKREDVLSNISECVKLGVDEQLQSGVGSVGAISSYGNDMQILANSPLRVIYFNEAIGSTPSAIDFLYSDFLNRYNASKELQSNKFIPAIAIHSPYSVHKVLAKKVLQISKADNVKTSVHFLESKFEREWLESSNGWFKSFYEEVLGIKSPKPLYNITEFLEMFEGLDTLFVHCLFASGSDLDFISKNGHIISCPRSNRLLNNAYIDFSLLASRNLHPIFATDGKSSNNNLNMLDELRSALFGYFSVDIDELSKILILGSTLYPARALGLECGTLQMGKLADISVFQCPQIDKSSQSPLQFLLHSQKVKTLYINGKDIIK